MASPPRVAGPDGMTMIRELPANPLRTRDPRSNGAGLARRATNDVGIIGLDRPRPAASESSRHGLAPTGGRTGWDDDDPGTARKSIATRDPRSNGAGWRGAQPTMSGIGLDQPAASESSTEDEAWPRPHGWPDRMG